MKFKVLFILFFATIIPNVSASEGVFYYKSGFSEIAKNILLQDLNSSANKAEVCYYLGNIYFVENKVDSAAYYFSQGLKADPLNSLNTIGNTMLTLKNMDPKVADATFTKILKLKPNKKKIAIPIAVSYAFFYVNNTAKALEYQNRARSINSKSPDLYVLKGDILASTNLGEACANYETAILYNKNCKEAYIKYARAYKNMNSKLAIEKLLTLKEISPDFALVDKELGDIYYSTNDFDNAAKHYEVYIKSGKTTNVSDLVQYATTLFFNQNYTKSLEIAKLGLAKNAKNPAFNRLSMYNYVDLKETDNALKAADLFFNNSEGANYNYNDYRYFGRALKDAKKFKDAAEQFSKALSMDTTKFELLKDISDMYAEVDSFSNAIATFNKFLKLAPEKQRVSVDNILNLGRLYYTYGTDSATNALLKKEVLMKADSTFALLATIEPDGYRGGFWRARVNSALDPETTAGLAKPYYEKTAALLESKNDPRYNQYLIECYSYLGYYMLLQKDNAASIAYWNKILAINPNNATAKKAIAGIQAPKKKK